MDGVTRPGFAPFGAPVLPGTEGNPWPLGKVGAAGKLVDGKVPGWPVASPALRLAPVTVRQTCQAVHGQPVSGRMVRHPVGRQVAFRLSRPR